MLFMKPSYLEVLGQTKSCLTWCWEQYKLKVGLNALHRYLPTSTSPALEFYCKAREKYISTHTVPKAVNLADYITLPYLPKQNFYTLVNHGSTILVLLTCFQNLLSDLSLHNVRSGRDFSHYIFVSRRNGKGEKHKGVDVICADGATVYAPFSGELSGPVKFFHNGNAIDDGVQIRGSGIKLFSFISFNSSF